MLGYFLGALGGLRGSRPGVRAISLTYAHHPRSTYLHSERFSQHEGCTIANPRQIMHNSRRDALPSGHGALWLLACWVSSSDVVKLASHTSFSQRCGALQDPGPEDGQFVLE